jgi:hypothetical protein
MAAFSRSDGPRPPLGYGVGATGTVSLVAKIASTVPIGTTILNQAQFTAAMTFAPPAGATTLVVP